MRFHARIWKRKNQEFVQMENSDFKISKVGSPRFQSPISERIFESDESKIVFNNDPVKIIEEYKSKGSILAMDKAGPRAKIFHNPANSIAAILTAGGLCPGINDVIKGVVNTLCQSYGVKKVYGLKYGYRGLVPDYGLLPVVLDPDVVDEIHTQGGTILGSSRGPQDINTMVDSLIAMNINILFCIGGDGTLKCAHKLAQEILHRKLPISVIGIPKTIDNDISMVDKTFGFETAIYKTDTVISAAHNEAKGAFNGVGLIHVMGRDSGFIAVAAALANTNVNYCFIPEINFALDGKNGFLEHLLQRLDRKQHAVIIVSEGAGQNFFAGAEQRKDVSGNTLHNNIGLYLKDRIVSYAKSKNFELSIKYFDPTYLIRGVEAEGTDAVFCVLLAENAVHAAMAGFTDMLVGLKHFEFTHVPIDLATRERKKVDTTGQVWKSLVAMTNQPNFV